LIAVGGEGAVHRIEGSTEHLAKLYHQPPTAERATKLRVLAGINGDGIRRVTAMPVEVLYHEQMPVGFVMPMAGDRVEVHHWYSPKDRKHRYPQASYDLLVAIARNLAACVDEIHRGGLVIGDINERGFLIGIGKANLATVTAIDCDSFQVIDADGRRYACEVGIPEYLPPELAGTPLNAVDRSAEQDRFGLAVLLFKLLLMGRHPYSGVYQTEPEEGLATAIARGWYVHGPQAAALGVRPPPICIGIDAVGPTIASLWIKSFTRSPIDRPAASEWVKALDVLQSELVGCTANTRHRHRRSATGCPWCAFVADHRMDYFPRAGLTHDVVFDLPLDDADALVASIHGWLLHLQAIAVPRPSPSDPRPAQSVAKRRAMEALEALLDPLRIAATETKSHLAEVRRRASEADAWIDECIETGKKNGQKRQSWLENVRLRRQEWLRACALIDNESNRQRLTWDKINLLRMGEWRDACVRIDTSNAHSRSACAKANQHQHTLWANSIAACIRADAEAFRHHEIATAEHHEWMKSNRDTIVLTAITVVLVVCLIIGLTKFGGYSISSVMTVGITCAGFAGLLSMHVLFRQRAKRRPPSEPRQTAKPPEPVPLPEPMLHSHPPELASLAEPVRQAHPVEPELPEPTYDPRPPEPRFPVLSAPFHCHMGAVESAGRGQAAYIVDGHRFRVSTAAQHARKKTQEWEEQTARDLASQVDDVRATAKQLDVDLASYRRLRTTHVDRLRVANLEWEKEAISVFLDTVQVADSYQHTRFGPGMISMLESFGVETALDVMERLVSGQTKVPGFGQKRIATLEEWVRDVVVPRFDRTKCLSSSSPRVQQVQRETLAEKARLDSAISSAMERITSVKASHDRLYAERRSLAESLAGPLRDALLEAESMDGLMTWWEESLRAVVD